MKENPPEKKCAGSAVFLLTLILSSTEFVARANILELNDFRMSPLMLVKKQDFTYSGGFVDDEIAEVRFDLSMQPMNTEAGTEYAFLAMTTDQDQSKHLVKLLTNE